MLLPTASGLKPTVGGFDPEEFRRLLHGLGAPFTWHQACPCPCLEAVDDESGRIGCPSCKGTGFFYHSAQTVKAIVTRADHAVMPYVTHGDWAEGHVNLTLEAEHLPGLWDRFEAELHVLLMRELIERSGGASDAMRYPIVPRTLHLTTGDVTRGVTFCRKATVDGDGELVELVEGIDFAVTAAGHPDGAGRMDWAAGDILGTAPPPGRRYGLTYYTRPLFMAIDYAYAHRDTFVVTKVPAPVPTHMLVQVRARLEFVR